MLILYSYALATGILIIAIIINFWAVAFQQLPDQLRRF